MTHSRNTILNKSLPRAFGISVLIISLLTILWLSRNAVLFGTKAATSSIPRDVQISNINPGSFTVSYVTDESVSGSITYGKDSKLGTVSFDTRDKDSPTPHRIHYITTENLIPSTNYFFSIVSGGSVFQNNSAPYQIMTAGSKSASPSAKKAITGNAKQEAGSPPSEGIVYLESDGSQLISSLLKQDGSYSILLGSVLKKDLSASFIVSAETLMHMRIVDELSKSKVSFLAGNADPLPAIILSRDYDFTIPDQPTSTASVSAQITGFPVSEDSTASSSPQILTPKSEQEFKDQKPTFQGKALPDAQVEITIHSTDEINTTVQADKNGVWKFRPDVALSPGQHTLTVKSLDASGILRTLTQSFTVFAEGSQFTEPSISPTPISTATPTPRPTIATPSPTASSSATPTATPTIITTSPTIASSTAAPTPNITTPPIPKSGSSAVLFGAFGLSLMVIVGSVLFFWF